MANHVNYDISKGSAALFAVTSTAAGTYYSSDIQNTDHRGIVVGVKVTTDNTTGTLTVTIQGKNVQTDDYYDILSTTALNVASGFTSLKVYPGLPATANASANDVLPAVWRIKAVVATNNVVAGVGASVLV